MSQLIIRCYVPKALFQHCTHKKHGMHYLVSFRTRGEHSYGLINNIAIYSAACNMSWNGICIYMLCVSHRSLQYDSTNSNVHQPWIQDILHMQDSVEWQFSFVWSRKGRCIIAYKRLFLVSAQNRQTTAPIHTHPCTQLHSWWPVK